MYSLCLCVWCMFRAICDFFNLKPYSGFEKYLTEKPHRKYRIIRGIIFLFLAGVAFGIFYTEIMLKIYRSFGEACLWYGIPYLIPLIGLFALQAKYNLPPFREEK